MLLGMKAETVALLMLGALTATCAQISPSQTALQVTALEAPQYPPIAWQRAWLATFTFASR